MMPDRIQITHRPRTMTTPRTALTSDDIPPGPLSATSKITGLAWPQTLGDWNLMGPPNRLGAWRWYRRTVYQDGHPAKQGGYPIGQEVKMDSQLQPMWESLVEVDNLNGPPSTLPALSRSPATQPAPEEKEGLSLADVDELCAKFNFHLDDSHGESLEILQQMICDALSRWGPPSAAAPEPGENLATPPAPETPADALAARPLLEKVAQWLHAHALDCRVMGRDVLGNDWAEQCTRAATLLQQQEAELAALRQQPHPTFQDAIKLAEGCHDYSGGHSGAEGEAWHGAIGTVVAVLKRAAVGPWDSQTMVVYGVGAEAGVGEVAVSEPVSECPHCGYEGEMVPAPQPGEVEA